MEEELSKKVHFQEEKEESELVIPISENSTKQEETEPKVKKTATEKKKERENKKASATQITLECNVCEEKFQTRNQLFKHVNQTGHASTLKAEQLETKGDTKKTSKKKK